MHYIEISPFLQHGFITRQYSHYAKGTSNGSSSSSSSVGGAGGGSWESVFFHMNSLASGCEFSDLHSGDEVEFLLVSNSRGRKNSAIHVKKLRYVCVCMCMYVCACV